MSEGSVQKEYFTNDIITGQAADDQQTGKKRKPKC